LYNRIRPYVNIALNTIGVGEELNRFIYMWEIKYLITYHGLGPYYYETKDQLTAECNFNISSIAFNLSLILSFFFSFYGDELMIAFDLVKEKERWEFFMERTGREAIKFAHELLVEASTTHMRRERTFHFFSHPLLQIFSPISNFSRWIPFRLYFISTTRHL
jgi:hypothetical protein